MRIDYHANARIPSLTANSVQIMKMCAALAEAGHDVTLIVPRFDRRLPARTQLEQQYGIALTFRIVWLRGWRPAGRLWFETRALLHALRSRADLYFTRNERLAATLTRLGRPVLLEVHQPPRKPRDVRALRAVLRRPSLRALVVISHSLRRILEPDYPELRAATVLVEHDGVDLARFADAPSPQVARRAIGWPETVLTVGYAGHLYAGRGIELIFALAERFPRAAFRIMGGEHTAVERVREEAAALGLANVELSGHVANAELPHYLSACDVLLMPYGRSVAVSGGGETSAFASPLKMFEYMAAGRLIIASRLTGIAEVLHDGNALLCEPDNVTAWAAALERAHDATLRERLAARARTDVEEYAWDRRVRRILAAVQPRAHQ